MKSPPPRLTRNGREDRTVWAALTSPRVRLRLLHLRIQRKRLLSSSLAIHFRFNCFQAVHAHVTFAFQIQLDSSGHHDWPVNRLTGKLALGPRKQINGAQSALKLTLMGLCPGQSLIGANLRGEKRLGLLCGVSDYPDNWMA